MRLRLGMIGISTLVASVGCGGSPVTMIDPEGDSPVGRWAAQTSVSDFDFAEGREVELDEVFELTEGGGMRGDFAGIDDVTGCLVSYQLDGSWAANEDVIDVGWDSIYLTVSGCYDPEVDTEGDVTADEAAIWDDELDGTWVITPSTLSIATADGALTYQRVTSPLVAYWQGTSSVSDLTFAPDREVELSEDFWLNQDGSMVGYFTADDTVTGCYLDYRLFGTWSATDTTFDASWTDLTVEVLGCDDPSLDSARDVVDAEEVALWNAELDGEWTVTGETLTLVGPDATLVYTRP